MEEIPLSINNFFVNNFTVMAGSVQLISPVIMQHFNYRTYLRELLIASALPEVPKVRANWIDTF